MRCGDLFLTLKRHWTMQTLEQESFCDLNSFDTSLPLYTFGTCGRNIRERSPAKCDALACNWINQILCLFGPEPRVAVCCLFKIKFTVFTKSSLNLFDIFLFTRSLNSLFQNSISRHLVNKTRTLRLSSYLLINIQVKWFRQKYE